MRTVFIIALSTILFSSCVKVYNCECKTLTGAGNVKFDVSGKNKKTARRTCTEYGQTVYVSIDTLYSCDISSK